MKQHKGELWGMCNLFKESLHKVNTQEIFANERPDVHYHLRQMDTQEFGGPSPCSAPGLTASCVIHGATNVIGSFLTEAELHCHSTGASRGQQMDAGLV